MPRTAETFSRSANSEGESSRRRLSTRMRIGFWVAIWVLVLGPFLFLRSEWFGRPLSDQQIGEYLHSDHRPKQIQYALLQIGERMARHDASVTIWYPDLVRLSRHFDADVRATDALVMGEDPGHPELHEALAEMLRQKPPEVRLNAALSLARFGDASGHDEIMAALEPVAVQATAAGAIADIVRPGMTVHDGAIVARVNTTEGVYNVMTRVAGKVVEVLVKPGDTVVAGQALLTVAGITQDDLVKALQAINQVGRPEDLPVVLQYQSPAWPEKIRQQAVQTSRVIQDRANH